jgi:hypothetical protein
LATAQFTAIGAFEWVRLATTRFYPGADLTAEPSQKATLLTSFLGSAAIVIVGMGAIAVAGAPVEIVSVGGAIAIGQGATDMHLTMCRFRQHYGLFAANQIVRATLLFAGAIGGAYVMGLAVGAAIGMALGYLLSIALSFAIDGTLRHVILGTASALSFRAHFRYGVPAAAASIIFLGSTLSLRYGVSLISPEALVPGFLLAIDLLQKPFTVIAAAIFDILYPPAVAAYDSADPKQSKKALNTLLATETTTIFIVAIALFLFRGLIANYVVSPALRSAFLQALPLTTLLMALKVFVSHVISIRFHLAKRSGALAVIASADLIGCLLGMLFAGSWFSASPMSVFIAAMLSSVLTILISRAAR